MFESENANQREATLLHYWRILKKRQLTVGLFCGILMGTVAIGTMLSTPFYGSTATLEIIDVTALRTLGSTSTTSAKPSPFTSDTATDSPKRSPATSPYSVVVM